MRVIDLTVQCAWIRERSALFKALLNEAEDEQEANLILDAMQNFTYYTASDYECAFSAIVEKISGAWLLNPVNTQIIAVSWDNFADSGQAVLHALKPYLAKAKLTFPLINSATKFNGLGASHPNIVLIDEFFGTGKTLCGRIEYIKKNWKSSGVTPKIYVAFIAGMESAIPNFSPLVEDVFVHSPLKKGITEIYTGSDLNVSIEAMSRMEARLAPLVGDEALPNFGYGKSESLFGSNQNIPNSTFPIFWWPEYANGSPRDRMFYRYG